MPNVCKPANFHSRLISKPSRTSHTKQNGILDKLTTIPVREVCGVRERNAHGRLRLELDQIYAQKDLCGQRHNAIGGSTSIFRRLLQTTGTDWLRT